jgi:protein phosphatase
MAASFAALTDRGQKRAINEDSVLAEELEDGSVLLAVADGVGGLGQGEVASAEAVRVLHEEFAGQKIDDPGVALEQAFARANQRIRSLGGSRESVVMATTLVAAFARNGEVWVANIGDSRAYILRGNSVDRLTRDHSVVAEQVLAGVLTAAEAETSEYRNVLTRGIGVDETVEPHGAGPVRLTPESVVLLCSDGLYRMVDDKQAAAVLSKGTASDMTRKLVDLANEAGGLDNISAVVMKA